MDRDPDEIYDDGLEAAKEWQAEERERYDRERAEIVEALNATDVPDDRWRWNHGSGRWVWVDSGSGPGHRERRLD